MLRDGSARGPRETLRQLPITLRREIPQLGETQGSLPIEGIVISVDHGPEIAGVVIGISTRVAAGLRRRQDAFIVVNADTIHVLHGSSCAHRRKIRRIITSGPRASAAKEPCRRRRPRDNNNITVDAFDRLIGRRQHLLHINSWANLTGGPLTIQVRLVPDLNRIRAFLRHLPHKSHKTGEINARGVFIAPRDAEQHLEPRSPGPLNHIASFGARCTGVIQHLELHPRHPGMSHLIRMRERVCLSPQLKPAETRPRNRRWLRPRL